MLVIGLGEEPGGGREIRGESEWGGGSTQEKKVYVGVDPTAGVALHTGQESNGGTC